MTEPTPTDALDRLLELTLVLGADMGGDLAARGLTPSRTHLVVLLHAHGPLTQRALADAMDVTPRNVTGLVDALVATGFVTREPHPTDRRATLVTLTAHGTEVTTSLDREKHVFAEQLFGSMDPDRLATFTAGLTDVLATIQALLAAGAAQGEAPSSSDDPPGR